MSDKSAGCCLSDAEERDHGDASEIDPGNADNADNALACTEWKPHVWRVISSFGEKSNPTVGFDLLHT